MRSHFEFARAVWNPWNAGDSHLLEKVQLKALNMISGLTGTTYNDKLKELYGRRLRFDKTNKSAYSWNRIGRSLHLVPAS